MAVCTQELLRWQRASGGEFLKLASPWCFQAWSAAELRKLASRVG